MQYVYASSASRAGIGEIRRNRADFRRLRHPLQTAGGWCGACAGAGRARRAAGADECDASPAGAGAKIAARGVAGAAGDYGAGFRAGNRVLRLCIAPAVTWTARLASLGTLAARR